MAGPPVHNLKAPNLSRNVHDEGEFGLVHPRGKSPRRGKKSKIVLVFRCDQRWRICAIETERETT